MVNEYNKLKKEFKRDIYKAIKEYEYNLAIKSKQYPKLLYQYVKQKQHVKSTITSLKNKNGDVCNEPPELVNIFNEHFQSVFTKNESEQFPAFDKRTDIVCETPIFSKDKIKTKLSELDVDTSSGFDGVSAHVLRGCANVLNIPLNYIFTLSMNTGLCPDIWKKANVTPLFKKGSKLDPGNYRPISLTSIVCKTMEKIIRDSLVDHQDNHNLISKQQHGFVRKKACVTNLLETIDIITAASSDKQAVDVAPHKRLFHKLKSYGITGHLLNWIESFLHKRYQRVVMGDFVSEWLDVLSGVAQGSVLGAILFIIFINEISDILHHPCKLYADDTKIIAKLKNDSGIQHLQNDRT